MFSSPLALFLLAATIITLRFRNHWAALAVCVAWSFLASSLTFFSPAGGQRAASVAEGCAGPATVFIGMIGILCVVMILYTSPKKEKSS